MTTDNCSFYLQNRLIQTSQTGGQLYSDTSPLVFPGWKYKDNKLLCNWTDDSAVVEQATLDPEFVVRLFSLI